MTTIEEAQAALDAFDERPPTRTQALIEAGNVQRHGTVHMARFWWKDGEMVPSIQMLLERENAVRVFPLSSGAWGGLFGSLRFRPDAPEPSRPPRTKMLAFEREALIVRRQRLALLVTLADVLAVSPRAALDIAMLGADRGE